MNKNDIKIGIGQRIRSIRKQKNITQKLIAEEARINKNVWNCYEKGKAEPKTKNLIKIATALGVEISDLLPQNSHSDTMDEQMLINKLKIECKNLSLSDRQLVEDFIKILERDDPKMRHILQTTMRAILEAMGSKTEN